MTGRRHVLDDRQRARPAHQQPDRAPCFRFIQTVERVAGGDAGLAARAAIQVDFERVLLPRPRRDSGQERSVPLARFSGETAGSAFCALVVCPAEHVDRGKLLLIGQQLDEQIGAARSAVAAIGRSTAGWLLVKDGEPAYHDAAIGSASAGSTCAEQAVARLQPIFVASSLSSTSGGGSST